MADDNKTPKQPSAVELEAQAITVRSEMSAIKIVDQASYDKAIEARKHADDFLKNAAAFFDGPIKDAHDLHKKLLARKKTVCEPVETTKAHINRELIRFDQEQERLRREEQRRLEEEARREAEAQRLADAEHMVTQGVDQDDALEMIVQEPVAVAAPVVEKTYVPSKAVSYATTYSGRVTDKKQVIAAAAEGNVNAREILDVNQTKLNGLARTLKEGLPEAVPGTEAVKSQNVRSGRG